LCFDRLDLVWGDEVNLVEEDYVGRGELALGLVVDSFRPWVAQLLKKPSTR